MSPFLCGNRAKTKILAFLFQLHLPIRPLLKPRTLSKPVGLHSQFGDMGQKLKGHPPKCVCPVIFKVELKANPKPPSSVETAGLPHLDQE